MRSVDQFFLKSVEKPLYHYTGIGALLNIVETRQVYASQVSYLNDSQEILLGCKILREVTLLHINECDHSERDFLMQLHSWLLNFDKQPHHIFIFSLSEQQSLLSQWRSYTKHGKGVSIGFSPERIQTMLAFADLKIAQCVYKDYDQLELMRTLLDMCLVTYRQERDQVEAKAAEYAHKDQRYFSFFERFRSDFLQVMAVIKHKAFEEEHEWRVISKQYPNFTVPDLKFREGASMLTPYIEIDLSYEGDETKLFERIVLGPSRHVNLAMDSLSAFLSNKRACSYIVNCGIPYREW